MKKFRDQKHKEKIIDRIRKLLAVSTGTSFEAEAATALRMAKGWMASYGLSIEEIEAQPAEENVDRKTHPADWPSGSLGENLSTGY